MVSHSITRNHYASLRAEPQHYTSFNLIQLIRTMLGSLLDLLSLGLKYEPQFYSIYWPSTLIVEKRKIKFILVNNEQTTQCTTQKLDQKQKQLAKREQENYQINLVPYMHHVFLSPSSFFFSIFFFYNLSFSYSKVTIVDPSSAPTKTSTFQKKKKLFAINAYKE